MEARSIRVPGADGLTLHALEWSAEGTPLVFLHGFSNDGHVWDDFAPEFAPYYRVLALDLRGHGDSDRSPDGRYDSDALVEDLEAALAALGIERLVLVGHSLGGRVSMRFAGRNPGMLAGLVLVDSGPEHDARGSTRISLDVQQQDVTFGSLAEYEAILARQYPEVAPELRTRLAAHWTRRRDDGLYELKMDPIFYKGRAKLDRAEYEKRMEAETKLMWEALRALPCPGLVVRGAASDILSPDVADEMADEAIPDGTLEVIARSGHSVMLDNPKDFLAALSRFALGE